MGYTDRDYYEYMEGEAIQDKRDGFDATFAIDFIREEGGLVGLLAKDEEARK